MASVSVDNLTKLYGATVALREVSLKIRAGEFITLLGPSGCGKSTLLRSVAGLLSIDRGAIAINDRDVTHLPVHRRNIGMVFQNLALFPHMTVSDNIAFGLRMRRIPRNEQVRRVAAALALVKLSELGNRYPHEISGGQQQRVAIARALIVDPGVLLLDEPFASLDRKLREEMQIELRELTRKVGITAIFVTHDQEEALTLSDRIAVMNFGRIEQVGAPDKIYAKPETRFVADFMGARNILETRVLEVNGSKVTLAYKSFLLSASNSLDLPVVKDQQITIAIRPDLIKADAPSHTAASINSVIGQVVSSVDQGAFVTVTVDLGSTLNTRVIVRRTKADQATGGVLAVGDFTSLSWRADDVILLRDASP
jgi:spermidine/putrescine ABC transporter ATP-binding subunit